MYQHKIPLHLETEDKFIFGLTMRQCVIFGVSACMGYASFSDLFHLIPTVLPALILGLVSAALLLVCGAVVALVNVYGRGLDEWAIVLLMYVSQPRTYLWHFHASDMGQLLGREKKDGRSAQRQEVDEW